MGIGVKTELIRIKQNSRDQNKKHKEGRKERGREGVKE
jgi:hypothetical protein